MFTRLAVGTASFRDYSHRVSVVRVACGSELVEVGRVFNVDRVSEFGWYGASGLINGTTRVR